MDCQNKVLPIWTPIHKHKHCFCRLKTITLNLSDPRGAYNFLFHSDHSFTVFNVSRSQTHRWLWLSQSGMRWLTATTFLCYNLSWLLLDLIRDLLPNPTHLLLKLANQIHYTLSERNSNREEQIK